MGYNPRMTVPATSRIVRTFEDRAEALAHFFVRAGEAPRVIAFDDTVGCPLDQALAALEWTAAIGILAEDDLVHAAQVGTDAAAVVVERRQGAGGGGGGGGGAGGYIFAQRVHAVAHFLRATQGMGAVLSLLGRRAPELRHIRRWMQALFAEPGAAAATQLLAGWFATGGAGCLFLPTQPGGPYTYHEVAIDS